MASTYSIKQNLAWEQNLNPLVSVITPVFNRPDELHRAFHSVEQQTLRNFEYIVINDGSEVDLDEIVASFMERVEFPMLYIKKDQNGGGPYSKESWR